MKNMRTNFLQLSIAAASIAVLVGMFLSGNWLTLWLVCLLGNAVIIGLAMLIHRRGSRGRRAVCVAIASLSGLQVLVLLVENLPGLDDPADPSLALILVALTLLNALLSLGSTAIFALDDTQQV